MRRTFESMFFSKQLLYIESNDVDSLMQSYHEDAILVLLGEIIIGREAIRKLIFEKIDYLVDLAIDKIDRYVEAKDIIVVDSIIISHHSRKQVGHIWLLRNGKLAYQIITEIVDLKPI